MRPLQGVETLGMETKFGIICGRKYSKVTKVVLHYLWKTGITLYLNTLS